MLDAIDGWREAQSDNPSRPEAIRRVLASHFAGPSARADDARSHAADAADHEMEGMDASAEEKTRRREALTDESALVTRVKAQRARRERGGGS